MPDDTPMEEKSRRIQLLIEHQQAITTDVCNRQIGKIEPISGDTGTLEEMTDDRLYRTGVGVGGRGYTLVERIAENWWFIEIYWPT